MKSTILIINGPNLNLLGKREPEIYGHTTLGQLAEGITEKYADKAELRWFHTNHEGVIIDKLHEIGFSTEYAGVVLNAGAFTHTSLAIADAIAAIKVPVVEVHISNIFAREDIRHRSLIAPVCSGSISGFGMKGYELAVEAILHMAEMASKG